MKKILIVDDHVVVLQGLASLINAEPDLIICGQAGSAGDALEILKETKPDLLVSDMNLPDRNGLELLKDVRILYPDVSVLVISMHDEMFYAAPSLG